MRFGLLLASGEGGQAMILLAVMLVVLLGMAGLALDVGAGYVQREAVQRAADAAALAGAAQLPGSSASAAADALTYAAKNGFTDGANGVTVTVNSPPTGSRAHDGDPLSLEVSIRKTVPTAFMRVLGFNSFDVTGHATATAATRAPCALCLLSPTATGALSGSGNGEVSITGGGVVVDSSASTAVNLSGNASVSATSIGIAGSYRTSGNATLSPAPSTGISPLPDPLASVPAPSIAAASSGSVSVGANNTETINPGIYTSLSVSGNGTLTLNPGTYVITGSVSVSGNGTLDGSGVTLYFTCSAYSSSNTAPCGGQSGGSLSLTGNGVYDLTAPTSGTYQGLTVFYDRGNSASLQLSGNASDNFTGTIYAKSAAATLSGNGQVTQFNSLVIANTATLSGNGTLTIAYNQAENYPVTSGALLTE